jgi:hypothetical protein
MPNINCECKKCSFNENGKCLNGDVTITKTGECADSPDDTTGQQHVRGRNSSLSGVLSKFKYKDIVFDDYTRDVDGHVWSQVCPECVKKYNLNVPSATHCLDDFGSGICGVDGCWTGIGDIDDSDVVYIDFIVEG